MHRTLYRRWQSRILDWVERSHLLENLIPLLLGATLGILIGLCAYIFVWILGQMKIGVTELREVSGGIASLFILLAGGLVGGYIVHRYAPETYGSGIPDVMEAVAIRRGRIRYRVAPLKLLTAAITIGCGGSAGREGPMVQIGASLGSGAGRLGHYSDEKIKVLVASGSAAGIAAAFNAPIAGIMFALEVVVGYFDNRYLSMVVMTAVSANIVSRALLGENPAFEIPVHKLNNVLELPLYTVVGVLCGLSAVLFIRALYRAEKWFMLRFPSLPMRTTVGLGLVGVIAIFVPGVLGFSLDFLEEAIADHASMTIVTMITLFILKFITTGFTLGSGNSGGIFAPVLFMGAMVGGIVGRIGQILWPDVVGDSGAFAVVGMAAMLAASVHAPMSSIIIIVEMSSDYRMIVPLLVSITISTLLADLLQPDSIYTRKLTMRGIRLERGQEVDLLQGVKVEEVMSVDYDEVPPDTRLIDLIVKFMHTHHHGFPIVDERRILHGVVSLSDVSRAQDNNLAFDTPAALVGTKDVVTVFPDDPIFVALRAMNQHEIGRLPVVSRDKKGVYLGVVRRSDIFKAYELALSQRSKAHQRLDYIRLRDVSQHDFIEVEVVPHAPMAGRDVRYFPYRKACLLVSIRRDGKTMIVHGDTRIKVGDILTAYADKNSHDLVRAQFASSAIAVDLEDI